MNYTKYKTLMYNFGASEIWQPVHVNCFFDCWKVYLNFLLSIGRKYKY